MLIAESNGFQQTCETNGFKEDTYSTEIAFEYVRGDVPLAIRTDNDGEFITDKLRALADKHGNIMETTSPDKSS